MFCSRRGKRSVVVEKRQGPMVEEYWYDKISMNFFCGGKEDKDMRRQRNGQTLFYFFKTALLGIY